MWSIIEGMFPKWPWMTTWGRVLEVTRKLLREFAIWTLTPYFWNLYLHKGGGCPGMSTFDHKMVGGSKLPKIWPHGIWMTPWNLSRHHFYLYFTMCKLIFPSVFRSHKMICEVYLVVKATGTIYFSVLNKKNTRTIPVDKRSALNPWKDMHDSYFGSGWLTFKILSEHVLN